MSKIQSSEYDAIIIGAGMSGLSAGIRLAMYDKRVCILEQHSISGGLNSYFRRGPYKFDVGLHALTNFSPKGERKTPLGKILKQLRLPYEELELTEQQFSSIQFPDAQLKFSNQIDTLIESISRAFPKEKDAFLKLIQFAESYEVTTIPGPFVSAKSFLHERFSKLLSEMILFPLLIYGSAWEYDMDLRQFITMFKSIYLEGLCRPKGGIRKLLKNLVAKFKDLGGELYFRTPVQNICTKQDKVQGLTVASGEFLKSDCIFSSAGYPETLSLMGSTPSIQPSPGTGRMSFMESTLIAKEKPASFDCNNSLIFLNKYSTAEYRCPEELFDPKSAVICLPNNFERDDEEYGIYRVTNMANYKLWKSLSKESYQNEKAKVFDNAVQLLKTCIPNFKYQSYYQDTFSPTTVEKFTRHFSGTVYGSPDKQWDGKTNTDGLYLCGTDQGYLGVTGAMLSGIIIANTYGLKST